MSPPNHVSRRSLIRQAAAGLGAGVVANAASGTTSAAEHTREQSIGRSRREVWVASLCQHGLSAGSPEEMCRKILNRMEQTLPMQPDVICLPECFHVANVAKDSRPRVADASEQPIGAITKPFAEFAKTHRCNLICPVYTTENGRFYNSAVVIDREGNLVGEYRKINPTDGELDNGITPGPLDPPVFKLDFGTIGVQTCFDINWHSNWRRLSEKGAEIVFWPSAFAGGEMLNALAWINKYYVVSSTRIQATKIVDVLGDEIVSTGRFGEWVCSPINLDVAVVQGWQTINRLEEVRAKYGRHVNIRIKHVEAWAKIESLSEKTSIAEILREFELETSNEMLARNESLQNARRPRSIEG